MWLYALIGFAAGSIVSCWQGYKDPPWEGFVLAKFMRSILTGVALGVAAYWMLRLGTVTVDSLGVLLLAILATERLVGETYKGFLRRGPHPEYHKLLHRLRIPAGNGSFRILSGILFLAGGLCLYWGFGRLGGMILDRFGEGVAGGLLVGGAAGTLVAIGGAAKDSQFEGFKPKKFVRSPIMAALGTTVLVRVSDQPWLISIGAIGLERVMVEWYKTFFTRQVRGIHAGKAPTHPEWLERRWVFYVGFLMAVAFCGVLLVAGKLMKPPV